MPLRVLLADDHVLVRPEPQVLLEREGFKFVADASDGQEPFVLPPRFQPDIAVMDISMPYLRTECRKGNGADLSKDQDLSPDPTRRKVSTCPKLWKRGQGIRAEKQCQRSACLPFAGFPRPDFILSPGVSQAVVEAYHSNREAQEPFDSRERQFFS